MLQKRGPGEAVIDAVSSLSTSALNACRRWVLTERLYSVYFCVLGLARMMLYPQEEFYFPDIRKGPSSLPLHIWCLVTFNSWWLDNMISLSLSYISCFWASPWQRPGKPTTPFLFPQVWYFHWSPNTPLLPHTCQKTKNKNKHKKQNKKTPTNQQKTLFFFFFNSENSSRLQGQGYLITKDSSFSLIKVTRMLDLQLGESTSWR